ncbi:MAG: flagellar motor protein MotB [Rhodospirillales bacterium]
MAYEIPVQPAEDTRSHSWLIIFTDLVSLMLTFFVLLFSMSNLKVDKWESITDSLSQSLSPTSSKKVAAATAQFNIASIFRKRAINLDYLSALLEDMIPKDPLLAEGKLIRLEDRLIITLPGKILFAPGDSKLTEKARESLFNLGGVLRNIGNEIGVNSHTAPGKVQGTEYESNWELSLARSISVANELRRSGYTETVTSYGYADSLYSQLPEMPENERRELSQRIDIVIRPTIAEES